MPADEAFLDAGKQPGLEIWRIEKLKVVAQDPGTYGSFYSGDSYICLYTKLVESHFEWDIHFWLGKTTSQDEAGVCAYKTVELDDHLGGAPIQYREVQDHESKKFLTHFKNGVKYLEGGVESGFKKVKRGEYEKRLFHVKGKRNVRCSQVELSYKSLNSGDVFILDDGLTIYAWNGKDSSRSERVKGVEVANGIKNDERGGKAKVIILDEGDKKEREMEDTFFKALGGRGPVASSAEAGDDQEHEQRGLKEITLYRVSDAGGQLEITEVDEKPLTQDLLDTLDSFILDCGSSGVFVWVGKGCTKQERSGAMKHGTDFITAKGYPNWTPVVRLAEGGETPIFKQYFSGWKDANSQKGLGSTHSTSKVAKAGQQSLDKVTIINLHKKKEKREEHCPIPDEGSATVKIWRVEKFANVLVDEKMHGKFYNGDSYVLEYKFRLSNKEQHYIFYWQGSKTSVDEKAASAIFAQQRDDEANGTAVQIRVVQGKEPEMFLRLFEGKMVIYQGGKASGFRNKSDSDSGTGEDDLRLFQIRGTTELNTKAIEVTARAASLNSNDVFVLQSPEKSYIWRGKGSSTIERRLAKNFINLFTPGRSAELVREGVEKEEFWDVIGGTEPYHTSRRQEEDEELPPARLFQCSNASGKLTVEEIEEFDQEDLFEDDVMLLDAFSEVYVWVGSGANDVEKKESLSIAGEYVQSDESGRTLENTDIMKIAQGFEPPSFTAHFPAWDSEKWSGGQTYEELKKKMGDKMDKEPEKITEFNFAPHEPNNNVEVIPEPDTFYSFEDLKIQDYELLPRGVPPDYKEQFLNEEEFKEIFKMDKASFNKLRRWKRIELKKKCGMF